MFGFGGERAPPTPIGERNVSEQHNQIPMYQQAQELGQQMLNVSGLIENIRLQLLGYVDVGNGKYQQIGLKLMNEKGAGAIVTMLHSHVGQEVFLTKITDYDKVRILRDLWSTMIRLLINNRIAWDLGDDVGNWRIIRAIVVNQVYFALCRGVEGTEKRFFGDVYQNKTVLTQQNQQQFKKGFLQ